MADSSTQRNNPDGSVEVRANETMHQLYSDPDPDLLWIIDAEGADALSTCDHSDHEHVMQSSSSESLDDMQLLGDDAPNTTATSKTLNAMQPQRSVSIPRLPKEHLSPVSATSKVIRGGEAIKMTAIPTPVTPSRTLRQPQNQRLMKINGDDTILNLYAATVAKAVSPPPPTRKEQLAKAAIAPVVTSPTNKPRAVFPRSSLTIRPEISKPTKKATVPSTSGTTTTTTIKPAVNSLSVDKSNVASGKPTTHIDAELKSPKKSPVPISSASPLTKARSMATGNAKMPTRIKLEVSDHDDEDDAILESFDSQLDNNNVTAPGSNTSSGMKMKVDTGNNYVDRLKAIAAADAPNSKSSISLLDASPETEQQHQQYLQLEIAKELDGGRNSRRFQLAIQSHVSSLTLGTFTDQEMNGDDLSISGATFRSNYSLTSGYNCDDDETFATPKLNQAPPPTPPALTNDEAIEVSLDDGSPQAENTNTEEGITRSPNEKAVKVTPPALLYQRSHSWMRNRLWGQQLHEQLDPDPERLDHDHGQSHTASDVNDVVDVSQGIDIMDSPSKSPDAQSPKLSMPKPNDLSPVDSRETQARDFAAWNRDIAFYCLFYIIPFTYQAGTSLPQIYFLIELVDVYETDLYLAGIYLCTSLLMRFAIQSFVAKMPRIVAVIGTIVALTGYLVLFLISELDKNQLSSESNKVNEFLFIFGNIIIGSNEIISCTTVIAEDDSRLSSTSSCVDSGNKALLVRGWETQFNIIQLSTVIVYAIGGVVYEYWDIIGIAVTGIVILGVQLISLLVVIQTEPTCPTKQSISQESQKINFFQPDCNDFDVSNNTSSSYKGDMKLRRDDNNISFRSIVTPELATIEESPVAESDSEDDPSTRISYFDAERSEQLQLKRQSFVSNSSGTPEFDNRSSIKEMNAIVSRHKSEQYSTVDLYEAMINNHVPPLQWAEIFVAFGILVQPIMKGLVLGVGTLLLFQEFGREKSTIGYIYAAVSLCGVFANVIPQSLLDYDFLGRFNTYGAFYLFCATYMILLTAISVFSTYIVGVLVMSLFIGLFVRLVNAVELQLINSNSKYYERIIPYRKWIRLTSSLLVALLSPILYDVLPRLPNMIGSGVCFVITVFVWCGSNAAKENDNKDGDVSKVNTTADTIPSEAINESMKHEDEEELSKLELAKSLAVHRIRLESLLDRSI